MPARSEAALAAILADDDPAVVGVVLSGSAARGMATDHSDVDVYVVLADGVPSRSPVKTPEVDKLPVALSELEDPEPFGTEGWWMRWSFAWAQVLRDDTGGRLTEAVRRQAMLDDEEQRQILIRGDRLDGWLNFAYRAAKSTRDGRPREARFDAAESVPWLLDVIFTLAGRVRPYNKYLCWELREHPLSAPEWSADRLTPLLEKMLDGDVEALRSVYPTVERECRAWDRAHGGTALGDLIDSWGSELDLLRRQSGSPSEANRG
ncbi:MAG TPA: nucleotidyltransferase domain-containing protein [Nocardioides sp.]|nr:nucleotidyltransferase domain-containing protein [Nocardioides sp.]